MVRRRRRTTFALLGLATLTAVLMAAGMIPWPLQLAIDLVLVAFVVHLRTQARSAAAVARQRRQATVAAARSAAPARPARPSRSVPAVPVPAAPMADPQLALPAATVDVTWSDADTPAAVVEAEISVEETWEPVPVPRPTYTFMPPAPSPAAAAYDSDATEEMAPVVDDVPTDLDEILERRRAVND
jgi:hypothetical protein